MLFTLEPGTNSVLWRCPQCGKKVRFPNTQAANLADRVGLCRDCRLTATLERCPQLVWILKDFSDRSGLNYSFMDDIVPEGNNPVDNIIPIDRYRNTRAHVTKAESV